LRIAATELPTKVGGTLYPLMIPELLHVFRQRHSAARVNAVVADQAALIEQLRAGQISLALTYDMSVPPDMELIPLATLPPFAFVAARHELAPRKSIAVEELAEEPFLLLDLSISRGYFLSLFHRVGLVPNVLGRFQHIDVIRSLVARGEGFGLTNAPPRNRSSLDGHKLSYIDLTGEPRGLVYGVMVMRDMRHTKTAEAFTALCRELAPPLRQERVAPSTAGL
jgi:DNA-binding transcriptional LysR family regulator